MAHRLSQLTERLEDRRELAAQFAGLVERLGRTTLFAVSGEKSLLTEVERRLAAARDRIRHAAAAGVVGELLDDLADQLDGPVWRAVEDITPELVSRAAQQDELITSITAEKLGWEKRVAELHEALADASAEYASVLDDRAHVIALQSLVKQAKRAHKQEQYDQVFGKLTQLKTEFDDIEKTYHDKHQAPLLTVLQRKRDTARVLKSRTELLMLKRSVPSDDLLEYTAVLRTQHGPDTTTVNLPGVSEVIKQDREAVRRLADQVTEAVNTGLRKLSRADDPQPVVSGEQGEMATQLRNVGDLLYSLLVPDAIQRVLAESKSSLIISTNDMEIPWELMHDGENFLCRRRPLSRMPVGASIPRRPAPPAVGTNDQLKFLLIYADPFHNLPKAKEEVVAIAEQLKARWNTEERELIQVTTLLDRDATGQALNEALLFGGHHVIHYAGHAEFVREHPERSRLILAGEEPFMAQKAQRITRGTPMVFLNACDSSRAAEAAAHGTTYLGREHQGLASAFFYGGASAVVGALWPVYDDLAAQFAIDFYGELLNGAMVGEAMRCARENAYSTNPTHIAWAAYALYGDPTARLAVLPATKRSDESTA
ncbi:CHAT domain-containing protein [Lentzea alba]|uniref:CHAT domain-containing protein n=1 Tax=Lentzea alba TaxID=2714351 RepID=UPI0039BFDB3F